MIRSGIFRKVIASALAALITCLMGTPVSAAGYPERSVTFVVPFSAGAAPDILVRALASEMARATGVPVIVDNKPGAGSIIAAQTVARAAPDGYTVLVTGNVAVTGNPHVVKKLGYDPAKDFVPVNTIAKGALFLYVNRERIPAGSVAEIIQRIRKEPGRFSFAYTSITSRLPVEVLKKAAGLDIVGVPYRAGHAAMPDLLSGTVDMLVTDASGLPHVKSGKLGVIGVTDRERSLLAPEVPTFVEAGIDNMRIGFWLGAYLPANAPPSIVRSLDELLRRASSSALAKEAHARAGTVPFFLPPNGLVRFQAEETAHWGRLIRDAGIQPE